MELDELKNAWSALAGANISSEKISRITRSKYRSQFVKLILPEFLITVFNLYFATLVFYRLEELDTGFLSILGIATILVLLIIPALRIFGLLNLYHLGKPDQVHAIALKKFVKQKVLFQKAQRINIGLSFFLIVAIMILAVKIYDEFEVVQGVYFWAITCFMSLLFVFVFRKISKKYIIAIEEAEEILSEIQKWNDEKN